MYIVIYVYIVYHTTLTTVAKLLIILDVIR